VDEVPKENKKVVSRDDRLRQVGGIKKKLKFVVVGLGLILFSLYYFDLGNSGISLVIVLAILAILTYLLRIHMYEKNVRKSS